MENLDEPSARVTFTAGSSEIISTDDDDEDDDDDDGDGGALVSSVALSNKLFDFDGIVEVDDVNVEADAAAVAVAATEVNGEENSLSTIFVAVETVGVNLNVSAGASAGFDLATNSSIFLLSIVGAFGAGNNVVGILISLSSLSSRTFGKSTGSGGISCSSILPAFRCFEMILLRILLTCLLLVVVDDL